MADISALPIVYLPNGAALATPEIIAWLKTLPAAIEALKSAGAGLSDDCDALIAELDDLTDDLYRKTLLTSEPA